MQPLKNVDFKEPDQELDLIRPMSEPQVGSKVIADLERYLSLADAYIVRNDYDRAGFTLREAERYHSHAPELIKRLKLLKDRGQPAQPTAPLAKSTTPPQSRKTESVNRKLDLLTDLLHAFQTANHRT
jgi:hypothetical protein